MNELYEQTIQVKERVYRYDPDMDCYYRVHEPLSFWDTWGWILVVLVLGFICWMLSYYEISFKS